MKPNNTNKLKTAKKTRIRSSRSHRESSLHWKIFPKYLNPLERDTAIEVPSDFIENRSCLRLET